jgi:hypothetical protein
MCILSCCDMFLVLRNNAEYVIKNLPIFGHILSLETFKCMTEGGCILIKIHYYSLTNSFTHGTDPFLRSRRLYSYSRSS